MDENQENEIRETQNQEQEPLETHSRPSVSFPTMPTSRKPNSSTGKVILVVSVLAIVGVLGFFVFRGLRSGGNPSPTPESVVESASATPEATPTPSIDKTKIKIEVQNGTGISGEAAYLQDKLRSLGYTNIKVGNATSQDNTTTTVTFAKSTPQGVVDEITAKLQELYKKVESKTSSTLKTDVLILTGLRKGATPKPSAAPTVKPSASPSGTPTASPIPT